MKSLLSPNSEDVRRHYQALRHFIHEHQLSTSAAALWLDASEAVILHLQNDAEASLPLEILAHMVIMAGTHHLMQHAGPDRADMPSQRSFNLY